MAAFHNTREYTETKVIIHLLSEIDRNSSFTRRGLAQAIGIALRLMNQYFKSCTAKGWIRVSKISPRRMSYFLTPSGFREKSIMVTDYLVRSLTFFRDAWRECEEALKICQTHAWTSVALVGQGDLADIALLVFRGSDISVTVTDSNIDFKKFDGVIITDMLHPQDTYNFVKMKTHVNHIITPSVLHISRSFK